MTRSFVTLALLALGMVRPLLAQGYVITDLGTLGGINSEAEAINAAGQIAGSANTPSDNHACIWQNGGITNINLAFSSAHAISSDGRAVGTYFPSGSSATHAFLYSNGTPTDIGFLPEFPDGNSPVGVNKFGQVV